MMRLSGLHENKRVWLGGGAALAVLVVLAGWFMVINPQLSTASSNREQRSAADQQNQVLQKRNDELAEKNGDLGALQAGLSAALAQLPSDGGLPAFTRQLSAQASAAGVVLNSVIVGAAAPVAPADGQSAPTTAAQVPAAGTTAAAAPATAAGLVQMMITVNATGLGRHDLAFLRAVQWSGPRRALVTSVQLAPIVGGAAAGTAGSPVTGTTNGTVTGTTGSSVPGSPVTRTTGSRVTGTTGSRVTGTTGSRVTASPVTGTAGSTAPGTTVPGSTGADSTGSPRTGIDGPCNLTLTLTIFSAPLSPSAQAALEKLLGGK